MASDADISIIQRAYFSSLLDEVPSELRKLIIRPPRAGLIAYLANQFLQPLLYTAHGYKQSLLEVTFDRVALSVNEFWREHAQKIQSAVIDSSLYGITLQTQRFPHRLPEYLKRLALYFDCTAMVDLLHVPNEDSLQRILHDPAERQLKFRYILWFTWLVRAAEAALIDPDIPVFVLLPNTPYSPDAYSRAADLAAHYLAKELFQRPDIKTEDELHDLISQYRRDIEKVIANPELFVRLLNRFSDDEVVTISTGPSVVVDPQGFRNASVADQVDGVLHFIGTTFMTFRETTMAALSAGWDPVLYHDNDFLHEWFLGHVAMELGTGAAFREITPEDAAATALVGPDLPFLEAVTTEDIRHLRQSRSFRDLRESLSLSRDRFKVAARSSQRAAIDAFASNIKGVIETFAEQYQSLEQRNRSTRLRTGLSFGGATALTVASLAFPAIAVLGAIAAGTSVIIGGKSLVDLFSLEREMSRAKASLEARPLMLLYKASLGSEGTRLPSGR